jgi:hypothetical protein
MQKLLVTLGALTLWAMTFSPAGTADLGEALRRKAATAEYASDVECLRWIRQNQSWYNYCDLIPYRGRTAWYHYDWPWLWAPH